MKLSRPVLSVFCFTLSWCALSQDQLLSFTPRPGYLQLAGDNFSPNIRVASNEWPGVVRAASDLAVDFGRVVGTNGTLAHGNATTSGGNGTVIIAGTVGNSEFIDELVKRGKIDICQVEGRWESYVQLLVNDPAPGVSRALVVAGSDRRGTIYGLYDISETIGVSPWYWWADVPPKKKDAIYATSTIKIQGPPSVKYRGFFINDEAPSLTSWAERWFSESEYGSFLTSEFYKLIFELLLRLKANYLWPGMKGSMFYVDDPLNGELADAYGVTIGTSHHEPMTRAYDEQTGFLNGSWDWSENSEEIKEFMKEGVKRTEDWETVYTMGMRGEGDRESPTLTPQQLEEIIDFQQELLADVRGQPVEDIPQIWALYKEVGKYWQAGMNISDSVTLLWTDDNYGNIMRFPYDNETSRAGGAGVYYHFSYVGHPRRYGWLNTAQLVKTWEQMQFAHERGARQVWIANVGDLKPMEVPLTQFLDMAYDMPKHSSPGSTTSWIKSWATREFGVTPETAGMVAKILNTYGQLVTRRKYTMLGMSMAPFVYSTRNYDEAELALREWGDLVDVTQDIYDSLDTLTRIPFFEMVLHPVLAGKTMVEIYTKIELAKLYKLQGRTSTNKLAGEIHAAFDIDASITDRYYELVDGKWDEILSEPHLGFTGLDPPPENTLPEVPYVNDSTVPDSGIMGVSFQGSELSFPRDSSSNDSTPVLRSMDPYMPSTEKRWIDVYTRYNGTFSYKVQPNVSYVSVTNPAGTLSAPGNRSDARSIVNVNWDAAPAGLSWVGLKISRSNSTETGVTAVLPLNKTSVPSGFDGYIESNGVVSIEAAHYTKAESSDDVSYVEIPYYGRTHSGVKIWPPLASSQTPTSGPKLVYDFYTFSKIPSANLILHLGGSSNHDPSRPLRFAYAVDDDDGDSNIVEPVPNVLMGPDAPGWNESVITGGWTCNSTIETTKGAHSLNLWLLEPGVVLQKIVIDMGGLVPSGLGPPESGKIGGLPDILGV